MNILIACDKFKGSLDAKSVCVAISSGIKTNYPLAKIESLPLADGGDGTLEVLKEIMDGRSIYVDTTDPMNRKINAEYFVADNTAYIELALASGIALLKESEKNPAERNTIGTGILACHAMNQGYKEIVFCLGGSCTNDAGIGILHGLGFKFLDTHGKELKPIGKNLIAIQNISVPELPSQIRFKVLCDITNPLYGPNGAAYTFAKQKGADDKMIEALDQGLRHFSKVVKKEIGKDISKIPGGGSAGGIGAGLHGCLDAELVNGFNFLKNKTDLEERIKEADVVLTGEGKIDHTSMNGKLIGGINELCKKYSKPLYAIVGRNDFNTEEVNQYGFEEIKSIMSIESNLEIAIKNSARLITRLAQQIKF